MSLLDNPRLVEKLRSFYKYVRKNDGKIGQKQRGIDINFNNACNLRCEYCFTNSPKGDHAKDQLSVEMMGEIADQADELGIFEFDLQGGTVITTRCIVRSVGSHKTRALLSVFNDQWLLFR